jgi:hypothetical protein
MNEHLGYTPDGQPVTIWTRTSAWTNKDESFVEVGRTLIQLEHAEPGLADTLRASLKRQIP